MKRVVITLHLVAYLLVVWLGVSPSLSWAFPVQTSTETAPSTITTIVPPFIKVSKVQELKDDRLSSCIFVQNSEKTSSNNICPPPRVWKSLCPPLWNPQQETRDASIVWNPNDSEKCACVTECAARNLLERLEVPFDKAMVAYLSHAMTEFHDFCTDHMGFHSTQFDSRSVLFKARLVATRGRSGIKCPQWHMDDVPVRWIQSLVGPGCDVVLGEDGVNRDSFYGSSHEMEENKLADTEKADEDLWETQSVTERNAELVQEDLANIYSVPEGTAALLIGRQGPRHAKALSSTESLLPVVHRSPSSLLTWGTERVLLTQDVLVS